MIISSTHIVTNVIFGMQQLHVSVLCLFTTSSRATEVHAASKDGSQAGDVGLYLLSDVVVNYLS